MTSAPRRIELTRRQVFGLVGGGVLTAAAAAVQAQMTDGSDLPPTWLSYDVPPKCEPLNNDDANAQWSKLWKSSRGDEWLVWFGVSKPMTGRTLLEVREGYLGAAATRGWGWGRVDHSVEHVALADEAYRTTTTRVANNKVMDHLGLLSIRVGKECAVVGVGCSREDAMDQFWAALGSVEVV